MQLLRKLCAIHATSGDEEPVKRFLLDYLEKHASSWKTQPVIHQGQGFQDCLVLAFGKPRTAVFAHMDSIGFTVRYGNELVKIGSPVCEDGFHLTGKDSFGAIECILKVKAKGSLSYEYNRLLDPGTTLTFSPLFKETDTRVQCCYLDNRLGIYNALKLAETLTDGLLIFSCGEEHGGGSVGFLTNFMVEKYDVQQALISDITWVTEGVKAGEGAAISLRDSGIPRRSFVKKIVDLAKKSDIPFQLEVEGAGGSDGTEIQHSPFAIDWCFIGAAEENVHSPFETVHKADIDSMLKLYDMLMKKL